MPVEFVNLPNAVYPAEQAQALSSVNLQAERVTQQSAAAATQNSARQDQEQVQDPQADRPQNTRIREEEGGRQPWHRSRYQGGPGPEPAEEEKAPDSPDGRGQVVDYTA